MRVYGDKTRERIISLRNEGYTYAEICDTIGYHIPKGTLSYICRNVTLGPDQMERINQVRKGFLEQSRQKAVKANKRIFAEKIASYHDANLDIIPLLSDRRAKLIALAMLYLGEGAKWKGRRGLMLGSSDPHIIQLYISLLRDCYDIQLGSLKCRVQHRADQDPDALVAYWSEVSGGNKEDFYPCYVDKRTIGQVTKRPDYKGVCSVTCAGTHVQLELEQIVSIICEAI
jgi:hypothetical protein